MAGLPVPDPGRRDAEAFVALHLAHLVTDGEAGGSPRFRGGQEAADAALAAFDVTGYGARRNEVDPPGRRGASGLSPWIRHGLLPLRTVWDRVAGGPERDVRKFRDELLWQEYARHWYAVHGTRTGHGIRRDLPVRSPDPEDPLGAWDRRLACLDAAVAELTGDGWLVNQTRMWLASHWSVREGWTWRDGEDAFFRHLLDGSRAANRLGWQWTTGVGSSKPYGFSRWQVEKRAPTFCDGCEVSAACPIEDWPDDPDYLPAPEDGPADVTRFGPEVTDPRAEPDTVWLTAESLGTGDPALAAHPALPVVFVFDEPLLASLRLSAKRLVFLTETVAELATTRDLQLRLGRPADELTGRQVAVTHAPVPGFRRRAADIEPAEVHPWPWLCPPDPDRPPNVRSFSAWRRSVREPA